MLHVPSQHQAVCRVQKIAMMLLGSSKFKRCLGSNQWPADAHLPASSSTIAAGGKAGSRGRLRPILSHKLCNAQILPAPAWQAFLPLIYVLRASMPWSQESET